MAIPDHHRRNFQTLLRAAQDGNLALMECTDIATGELRYVLCAVGRDGKDYVMKPFGHLHDGNPFEAYGPPAGEPSTPPRKGDLMMTISPETLPGDGEPPFPKADICFGLVINTPHLFADADFRMWLLAPSPKFTWVRGGRVDEWSDVIVLVDPSLSGEGSDSDMPASAWEQILSACRRHLPADQGAICHYMVRLTNLSED